MPWNYNIFKYEYIILNNGLPPWIRQHIMPSSVSFSSFIIHFHLHTHSSSCGQPTFASLSCTASSTTSRTMPYRSASQPAWRRRWSWSVVCVRNATETKAATPLKLCPALTSSIPSECVCVCVCVCCFLYVILMFNVILHSLMLL